jgi:hypothetical protein
MEKPVVRRLIAACPLAAASLPAIVLGVLTAGAMLRAAGGHHPLWEPDAVNLSEAAALRDEATVVQLIRHGEDPAVRREVRADLVFNDRYELTAFEAAIAAGRAEIMDILLWASPPPGPDVWNRLRCLARLRGDHDVEDVLDRYRPESGALSCDGITTPWK